MSPRTVGAYKWQFFFDTVKKMDERELMVLAALCRADNAGELSEMAFNEANAYLNDGAEKQSFKTVLGFLNYRKDRAETLFKGKSIAEKERAKMAGILSAIVCEEDAVMAAYEALMAKPMSEAMKSNQLAPQLPLD